MSAEAEAAILGAALNSPAAADQAADLLDGVTLCRNAHRAIWDAICKVRAEGDHADLVTVTRRMSVDGTIEEAGDAQALADLAHSTPLRGNLEGWARLVVTRHRRERLATVAARLASDAQDEGADPDELADLAVRELTESSGGTDSLVDTASLLAGFDERITNGRDVEGWRLPWPELGFFRLPQNGLTVLTGLPGSGKTTWLDCALAGMMQRHDGMKVAFFSPEQAPPDNHLHELVWTCMGAHPTTDLDAARGWADWLTRRCVWIDDDRQQSPAKVLAAARRADPDVLVVDPYNNLEPDGRRGDRQDLEIQALLVRLRRFARSTSTAVVVVAHPRKMEKVMGTDDVWKVPSAGDISGGQEWWNHADAILTVWRNQSGEETDKFGHPAEVRAKVSKVRFVKWGRPGKGSLMFDDRARRYSGRAA